MATVSDAMALQTPEVEPEAVASSPAPEAELVAQTAAAEAVQAEVAARAATTALALVVEERERLLQAAQEEAAQYLAQAQEQSAAIAAEAYQQGLKQGEEEARRAVAEQLSPVLTTFQDAATEITHLRAGVLQQAEDDIITLAFQLARKIVQHEVLGHRQVFATTLRRALARVVEQDQVVVRVHPDDLTYATESQQELGCIPGTMQRFTVQSDASIGRGGCIVESSLGTIDARIEAQFEELEQRFRVQHTQALEARAA
jgi:flagellar assembly protein FliH